MNKAFPQTRTPVVLLPVRLKVGIVYRKRGPRQHNLQKVFRSPERERMQRTRLSSHGGSDYSVDDDHEMEAMAKVWAHPEDLHLFPVSVHCCSWAAQCPV